MHQRCLLDYLDIRINKTFLNKKPIETYCLFHRIVN